MFYVKALKNETSGVCAHIQEVEDGIVEVQYAHAGAKWKDSTLYNNVTEAENSLYVRNFRTYFY